MRISGHLYGTPSRDLRAEAGRDLFHFLPARRTGPPHLARLWGTHATIARRLAQLEEMESQLQHARQAITE